MRRLLFLDIDGVLCNSKSMRDAHERGVHPPWSLGRIYTVDPACVALLRGVVEEMGVEVVLSSAWRHRPGAFEAAMEWCGWPDVPLVGTTGETDHYFPGSGPWGRGHEIDVWREEHGVLDVPYVVLDDDTSDIHQVDHLVAVRTRWYTMKRPKPRRPLSKSQVRKQRRVYGVTQEHVDLIRASFLRQERAPAV